MVTHGKKKKLDLGPFADDGLVARALRGELEPVPAQPAEELAVYCEEVRVGDDGILLVHFREYDGNSKMIGDFECAPGSEKYAEVIGRHGELQPGKISVLYQYKDGRTELK